MIKVLLGVLVWLGLSVIVGFLVGPVLRARREQLEQLEQLERRAHQGQSVRPAWRDRQDFKVTPDHKEM